MSEEFFGRGYKMRQNTMQESVARRFAISDMMILVASTAFAFWLFKVTGRTIEPESVVHPLAYPMHASRIARPLIASWALAVVILAIAPRRSPIRAILRQPGVLACAVASSVILFEASGYFMTIGVVPDAYKRGWVSRPELIFDLMCDYASFAVAGTWFTLALGGWWSAGPNWLDRLGRALGIAFILTYLTWGVCLFMIGILVD